MNRKELDYIHIIANNDAEGINMIYQNFLPKIKSLITANGGSHDDALDVFQDAIIIIYEKVKKGDFELKSKFYTLLYGICRNLWGNKLQKKSFQEVTLSEESKYIVDKDLSHDLIKQEEHILFWSNLKKLGADCQELLKLFFERVKMKDIQEKMGYGSISYTKKRKFQCKEKLITKIKSDFRYVEIMKSKGDS